MFTYRTYINVPLCRTADPGNMSDVSPEEQRSPSENIHRCACVGSVPAAESEGGLEAAGTKAEPRGAEPDSLSRTLALPRT